MPLYKYLGNKVPISLIKLNLDYYHEYNTHYGQEAGDRNLREVARLLSEQVSHKNQIVARLQGAEFALLLPGISCADARATAESISH